MDVGKIIESIGSFFSGGDQIPWCDREVIAVSFRIPVFSISVLVYFLKPYLGLNLKPKLVFVFPESSFNAR